MRWFSAALITLVLAAAGFGADAAIVRIWPQWHNAEDFERIREYFGAPENDGRELVLRTHPEERSGLYFLVRVQPGQALPEARFVLEVIRPDSPEVKTYTFPVSLPAKQSVAELGLTAADWPGGRDAHPVAWKLTLLDRTGREIVSEQSFLWQKPAQ